MQNILFAAASVHLSARNFYRGGSEGVNCDRERVRKWKNSFVFLMEVKQGDSSLPAMQRDEQILQETQELHLGSQHLGCVVLSSSSETMGYLP